MPSFRTLDVPRWLISVCVLTSAATALPLQNITLPLPVGTSNHGTPGLLCTPTKWTDIALFFLFNYVAHAATVLTRPGERSDDSVVSVIGCLLFPVMGLYRGIEAIFSGAVFVKKDDLRKAARSGALCMVVRGNDWRPVGGEEVGGAVFRRRKGARQTDTAERGTVSRWDSSSTIADEMAAHVIVYSAPWINSKFGTPVYVSRQIVHGAYNLPDGYRLAIVPSDAQFAAPASSNTVIEVSATYNIVKALIALVQAGYAFSTLYRSQGDQIEQFGYAAFGLTVAPYAVMSTINLFGSLCRPDYPSLYLMENSTMDEARKRGGVFEGSVGRVQEESATICGCDLADGLDASQLHFSAEEDGSITATFSTTSPPGSPSTPRSTGTELEKSSLCSSLTQLSHPIKPLPEKLDYTNTKNDALLLIPCCSPVLRTPTTSTPSSTPARYTISALHLHKNNPPCRPRSYTLTFHPPSPPPSPSPSRSPFPHHIPYTPLKYTLTTLIALLPLLLTGLLTRFRPGSIPAKESATWRAYTMQWLVWGVFSGIWWVFDTEKKDASPRTKEQFRPIVRTVAYVASGSAAVGTFVVVGQMVGRYGVCVWVGE